MHSQLRFPFCNHLVHWRTLYVDFSNCKCYFDYRLAPVYDLLNTRIHVGDKHFALGDGLLPKNLAQGNIQHQFSLLADRAGIPAKIFTDITALMLSGSEKVETLTTSSFLDETTKRNYFQSHRGRLRQLMKV